jgi:hypothetical protein
MQNILSFDLVDTSEIPGYSWFFNFEEEFEETISEDDSES